MKKKLKFVIIFFVSIIAFGFVYSYFDKTFHPFALSHSNYDLVIKIENKGFKKNFMTLSGKMIKNNTIKSIFHKENKADYEILGKAIQSEFLYDIDTSKKITDFRWYNVYLKLFGISNYFFNENYEILLKFNIKTGIDLKKSLLFKKQKFIKKGRCKTECLYIIENFDKEIMKKQKSNFINWKYKHTPYSHPKTIYYDLKEMIEKK